MVTRVGAATGTTTATLPAHAVGDIIVLMAFRDGSLTPPTIPTGEDWMPLGATTAANTCSAVFVAKRCDSTSETVGTFTNATGITVGVWRPASGKKLAIGGWGPNSGTATSVTYPALPLVSPSVSWVAAMAGHRSINTTLESAPTGMTNVAAGSFVDATNEMALHDTNAAAASWPSTAVAVGGTASGWISFVVELREYTDVLTRYTAARDHPTDNALVIGAGHSLMAAAAAVNAGTMTGDAIKFGYLQQVADAFTVCVARSSDASFMGEQNSSSYNSPDLYNTNLALHGWVSSAPGIKGLGWGALTPAAASTLTWDADIAYDRLTVYYPRFTGSPEYTANVDGGASLATLNMNDAVGVFASESFSVSLATHQLRFVAAATGGYISGAIVWNSAVKQVTFLNCSAAGGLVSDFLVATTYAPLVSMRAFGSVALTIIHLDANEILTAIAVDTFRFSLAQFALERLFYGDVLLISSCYMSPVGTGISEATQRTYHDAVAQLATVLGTDFIRGTDQIATFAAGNALGYYDPDGVHMPAVGYGVGYKVPLLAKLNASSGIAGTASITEASDTSTATGTLKIVGQASSTEASDTSSATGTTTIVASASVTEAGDTLSAAGHAGPISGSATLAEADDTAVATGTIVQRGVVNLTEADDTGQATGALRIAAIASLTEDSDTATAVGSLPIGGVGSGIEASDTVSAAGAVRIAGTASISEDDDSLMASGASIGAGAGQANITEASDTLTSAAVLTLSGQAAITEAGDTCASSAVTALSGAGLIFEDSDTATALGWLVIKGGASITEESDQVQATGRFGEPVAPPPGRIVTLLAIDRFVDTSATTRIVAAGG